jgi:ubiquinone/menaquinone biosynthesis C-methylase UbiE
VARQRAKESTLSNARFVLADAAALETGRKFSQAFDYICAFDAIHDQSHPLRALKNIQAMLKPHGLFSMIDIKASSRLEKNCDHPMGPFLYTVSLMQCMPVGLNDQGRGLGMMWGEEQARDLLQAAGFSEVQVTPIPNDPFNLHFLCTP